MSCYIDTSALAKWYLPEVGSPEFVRFIQRVDEPVIGRLVLVELRCLLARRRRAGLIDGHYEMDACTRFMSQVAAGYLTVEPLRDAEATAALDLIQSLPAIPLRTLDALHVAAAQGCGAESLATADRVMAEAGEALGLKIEFFGEAA